MTLRRVRAVESTMSELTTPPKVENETKVERPRLHKVLLFNDDYTPREFVVHVLQSEFRLTEDEAARVMMTAHRKGLCVVSVYPKDVAETKATRATEMGARAGFPLRFESEPEE